VELNLPAGSSCAQEFLPQADVHSVEWGKRRARISESRPLDGIVSPEGRNKLEQGRGCVNKYSGEIEITAPSTLFWAGFYGNEQRCGHSRYASKIDGLQQAICASKA